MFILWDGARLSKTNEVFLGEKQYFRHRGTFSFSPRNAQKYNFEQFYFLFH